MFDHQPTQIILVRHGQTEWNRVERFRGRADIPLNDTGVEQAAALAGRIARKFQPSAVYSGPLNRTVKTAEPIAKALGLTVEILGGLVDIDYGDWQGRTPEDVEVKYPGEYDVWLNHPEKARIPSGESLDGVRARALLAMEDVADRHSGQTIVLVSHKVICKVLLCTVLGLDNSHFWNIEQDNAAMNIFERRDGNYLIKLVNDTSHLEG